MSEVRVEQETDRQIGAVLAASRTLCWPVVAKRELSVKVLSIYQLS